MQISLTFDSIAEMSQWLARVRVAPSKEVVKPQMESAIELLDIPVRALNCLKADGIETVEQLCSSSATRLLKIPNLGRGSFEGIRRALRIHGMDINE